MEYQHTETGRFLSRPNRFIAMVAIQNETIPCHVPTTGRCRELLQPGAVVVVQRAEGLKRKTKYTLLSVYKDGVLVNIDSRTPNKLFAEWAVPHLFPAGTVLQPEVPYGTSRFDFQAEVFGSKALVEVKGVTLAEDGVALFPDAPTSRGARHINELAKAVSAGFLAYAVFVIQRNDTHCFAPNEKTDKPFAQALQNAASAGVSVLAIDCHVTENAVMPRKTVPFCFDIEFRSL